MNKRYSLILNIIVLEIGLVWARSGFEKLEGGRFVDNLGKTLTLFSGKNPYPFVKTFLIETAIPNSQIFGFLTMYCELFVGVTLTLGSLILIINKTENKILNFFITIALLVSIFLSAAFWLAAGWMSASTDTVNLLMLGIEAVLFYHFSRQLTT